MITDWMKLALDTGALTEDGNEAMEVDYSPQALEAILGEEWIRTTVEHIVAGGAGYQVATKCLYRLHSSKAALYAYEIYRSSTGERAARAVSLIKLLVHPVALPWVEEFLRDPRVREWGFGVLHLLLMTRRIPYDDKAEALLQLALSQSKGTLSDEVSWIRNYFQKRSNMN